MNSSAKENIYMYIYTHKSYNPEGIGWWSGNSYQLTNCSLAPTFLMPSASKLAFQVSIAIFTQLNRQILVGALKRFKQETMENLYQT